MTPKEMKETKQLKDYVPLYIGCEMETVHGIGINLGYYYPSVWTEEGNSEPNGVNILFTSDGGLKNKVYVMNFIQGKFRLRPISDMTDEENTYWDENFTEIPEDVIDAAEQTRWLLSKHFDLFNLIESGLAIDKTNQ